MASRCWDLKLSSFFLFFFLAESILCQGIQEKVMIEIRVGYYLDDQLKWAPTFEEFLNSNERDEWSFLLQALVAGVEGDGLEPEAINFLRPTLLYSLESKAGDVLLDGYFSNSVFVAPGDYQLYYAISTDERIRHQDLLVLNADSKLSLILSRDEKVLSLNLEGNR